MDLEFISYKQALALKELGFDEPCLAFYQKEYTEETPVMIDDDYQYRLTGWRTCRNSEISKHYTSAPLYQQSFRWFREKYDLNYVIVKAESWFYTINGCNTQEGFNTYEEAELECLNKLIEICKNK